MGFLHEKPNILIDGWSWTADELAQRLRNCDVTDAGLIALSKITTDTAGADEVFRVNGLTKLVNEDKPPLIGITVTRPKVRFGRAGRFLVEAVRGIKPLIDVVKIDKFSEDDFQIALAAGELFLPRYPNTEEHVVLPLNKFGELSPNALYILKPIIVKEAIQRHGLIAE